MGRISRLIGGDLPEALYNLMFKFYTPPSGHSWTLLTRGQLPLISNPDIGPKKPPPISLPY